MNNRWSDYQTHPSQLVIFSWSKHPQFVCFRPISDGKGSAFMSNFPESTPKMKAGQFLTPPRQLPLGTFLVKNHKKGQSFRVETCCSTCPRWWPTASMSSMSEHGWFGTGLWNLPAGRLFLPLNPKCAVCVSSEKPVEMHGSWQHPC